MDVAGRRSAERELWRRDLRRSLAALVLRSRQAGRRRAVIAIGAVAAGGWPLARALSPLRDPSYGGGGIVYAGVAFSGLRCCAATPHWGFVGGAVSGATVWATDIFAYVVGRAIGGPLLWPRVSPNKTWAGAIGGLVGGVAAGTAVAYASGIGKLVAVGVVALVLSVLAQAGDLFESAVKRRFGAKDAGSLIPGHGGLMDRLDGFLVAALAALLIGILRQGTRCSGPGLAGMVGAMHGQPMKQKRAAHESRIWRACRDR